METVMKTPHFAALLLGSAVLALAGCVAVPAGPNGAYMYYPLPPATPGPDGRLVPAPPAALAKMPATLHAHLYPANESAAQTGVVTGMVTNMMNGKGRFQLLYGGETLVGEATAVQGDSKRGVASANGGNGGFMSCEYQMLSPRQGAGTCTISDGAKYQVHVGN
jgi:hypothetical protein